MANDTSVFDNHVYSNIHVINPIINRKMKNVIFVICAPRCVLDGLLEGGVVCEKTDREVLETAVRTSSSPTTCPLLYHPSSDYFYDGD